MEEIRYILATTDHIDLLVNARVEFMKEFWGDQTAEVEIKLREELQFFFEREILAQTYVSWLALEDEKLIGIGGLKIYQVPGSFRIPTGKMGYILNMHTLESHRRRGIASEIVARLEQTGRELGVHIFDLHASDMGEPVYVKAGFTRNSEPNYRKVFL